MSDQNDGASAEVLAQHWSEQLELIDIGAFVLLLCYLLLVWLAKNRLPPFNRNRDSPAVKETLFWWNVGEYHVL